MIKSQCQVRVWQRTFVFTGVFSLDQVFVGVPQTLLQQIQMRICHTEHRDAFQKAMLKSTKLIKQERATFSSWAPLLVRK